MTPCPCCARAVDVPPLDRLIEGYGITGHAAAVLRALWSGGGLPVRAEKLFGAMFEDDPDGGPWPAKMYAELRRANESLNAKLSTAGVSVVYDGRDKGWRLVLQGSEA